MSDQSGLIDGVQFDKDDPATRLFIAANYWRERAEFWKARAEAAATICETLPLTMEYYKYQSPSERNLIAVVEIGCRGAFAEAIRALNDSRNGDGHGWDFDTLEHCARLIEKRAEDRQLADCHLDLDTGAMEYPSYARDIGNALDEEAEDCAKIIRAQPAKVAK